MRMYRQSPGLVGASRVILVIALGISALVTLSCAPREKCPFPTFEPTILKDRVISWSHCWGDIDQDGVDDLFVVNHFPPPSVLINDGHGTFKDVYSESGMVVPSVLEGGTRADRHGAAFADYDNDGRLDLYVTVGAQTGKGHGENQLYRNLGRAKFEDVAVVAGLADPLGRGRGCAWGDFDNDGNLDLFVANWQRPEAPDRLYKNDGDGSFTDVAAQAGVANPGNSLSAVWLDVNGDLFPDLTVASGVEISLLINRKDGTFGKLASWAGRTFAWADYDDNGTPDLFISKPWSPGTPQDPLQGRHRLLRNDGKASFV